LNSKTFAALVLLVAPLMMFCNGCQEQMEQYKPVYVDPSFQEAPPSSLRLLPVVDSRRDTALRLDLDRDVRGHFAELMERHGYKIELVSWPSPEPLPPLPHDSSSYGLPQSTLIPYLPPGSTPVVVVMLGETTEENNIVTKGASAVVSAWAFDAATGKVLWADSHTGGSLYAGIDPILTPIAQLGWKAYLDAVRLCLRDLNSTLPTPKK